MEQSSEKNSGRHLLVKAGNKHAVEFLIILHVGLGPTIRRICEDDGVKITLQMLYRMVKTTVESFFLQKYLKSFPEFF